MPPDEVCKTAVLPAGFRLSVFASEPDVQNPIAITTDDRGRLWVAENYTWAGSRDGFIEKIAADGSQILAATFLGGSVGEGLIRGSPQQRLPSVTPRTAAAARTGGPLPRG